MGKRALIRAIYFFSHARPTEHTRKFFLLIFFSYIMKQLAGLYKYLSERNLEESSPLFSLASSHGAKKLKEERVEEEEARQDKKRIKKSFEAWLEEWKEVMRHYGFEHFGGDYWCKGKSKIYLPQDINTARSDIEFVREVYQPPEVGSRVSSKKKDNYMQEFHGDLIWLAPDDAWKIKEEEK